PSAEEELEIIKRTTADIEVKITPTLRAEDIAALTKIVRKVPVADHVARYAMQLARLTRRQEPDAPEFVREYVQWGAGPRASQYLVLGAKARAVLLGRFFVTHDDIRAIAPPVLRHRLKMNFNADAAGVSADEVIRRLLAHVPFAADEAPARGIPDVYRAANAG
ncbi:MAG TPA: AAA family ATPase, partial [Pirellulaceae bacterium]|nr:AAA family ATPase [Pirellulaceae bacterium]